MKSVLVISLLVFLSAPALAQSPMATDLPPQPTSTQTSPQTPLPIEGTTPAATSETTVSSPSIKDLEGQYQNLLSQNKYGEALEISQQLVGMVQRDFGPKHIETAKALNRLAEAHRNVKDFDKAIPVYERLLVIDEFLDGKDNPNIAGTLNNLGLVYTAKGDLERSIPFFQKAIAVFDKAQLPNDPRVVPILNNLAEVYRIQKDPFEAEALYKRVVEIIGKSAPTEVSSFQKALALNNLGLIYKNQNRYQEAENYLKQSVALYESVRGYHPDLAATLINLASVYKNQAQFDKAEPLYQRALSIMEDTLGPDHPDISRALNNISGLYFFQKNYTQAETLVQRALTIAEKNPAENGQPSPDVMISLKNLETIYVKMGDLEKVTKVQEKMDLIKYGPQPAEGPQVSNQQAEPSLGN